jgi:hypothetical protein
LRGWRRPATTTSVNAFPWLRTFDNTALDHQIGHGESGALQVPIGAAALLGNPADPFRGIDHGAMLLIDLPDGCPDVSAWSGVQVGNDMTIARHSDLAIRVVIDVVVVLG